MLDFLSMLMTVAVIAGFIGLIYGLNRYASWRRLWRGARPHPHPIVHMDLRMAVRPSVLGHTLPDGARLAALVLGTGLIDRTGRAKHGVPVKVLDPLPDRLRDPGPIADLVRARAEDLLTLARNRGQPIRLMWSGGVDSTAACVALMQACAQEPERLQIAYSTHSVAEYRLFHKDFVKKWKGKRVYFTGSVAIPMREEGVLLVTGEHGDQLFGSMLALDQPPERLFGPPQAGLDAFLASRLATPQRAETVKQWLVPVIEACPIPLPRFFDVLWWLNFSLKWQPVSLRLLLQVGRDKVDALEKRLQHFYRTPAFEQWALCNPDKRIDPSEQIAPLWASYKWPLKEIIRDFTGDGAFFAEKGKEPSLRSVMRSRHFATALDLKRQVLFQKPDYSLRPTAAELAAAGLATGAVASPAYAASGDVSFEMSAEKALWGDVESGDGDGGG